MSTKICSVEGCETLVGKHGAKGMCPKHYSKWKKWGNPLEPDHTRKQQPNEIANIVRDAMNYIDEDEAEAEAELTELVQEAEEDAQDNNVLTFEDIFPGAEELTSL